MVQADMREIICSSFCSLYLFQMEVVCSEFSVKKETHTHSLKLGLKETMCKGVCQVSA